MNSKKQTNSTRSQQRHPVTTATTEEKKKSPLKSTPSENITSPDFSSKIYLRRILREKQAKDLLNLDNKLVTEIRNIDSEMKAMVYENYSQFISATDAIEKVNQHLSVMDDEMTKLTKRVDSMVTGATGIASSLTQRF